MPFIGGFLPSLLGAGAGIAGLFGKKKKKKKKQSLEDLIAEFAKQEQAKRDAAVEETLPSLRQYFGPVKESPFYRSLLTTGLESTSKAYDQANVAVRRKAQLAGYGYEQPATQGSEQAVEAERARELAAVPREALVQATDPQFRAIGLRTGQAGLFDPLGAFGLQANLEEGRRRRRSSLWSALANLGGTVAGGYLARG